MKKLICLLLSCITVCGLTSCGRVEETAKEDIESEYIESEDTASEEVWAEVTAAENVEPEPEETNLLTDTLLTGALPYSNGIAWVQYDENGTAATSAIDTEGNVLFTIPDKRIMYCSAFQDGLAYYVEEYKNPNLEITYNIENTAETIVDENGNELYRTADSPSGSLVEEHILCQNGSQFLSMRHIQGMTENYWCYVLIDSSGNILAEHPFHSDHRYSHGYRATEGIFGDYYGAKIGDGKDIYRCRYLGDSIWWIADQMLGNDELYINFENGAVTITNNRPISDVVNGKFMILNGGVIDKELTIKTVAERYYDYHAHDGLFSLANSRDYEDGYYDFDGNLIIPVNVYPELSNICYPFYDDLAVITIDGADGKNYVSLLDKTGNNLFEPIEVSSAGTRVVNGCFIVQNTEGQYVLLDTTGLQVHNISADFEQLGGTVDRWYDTDNGAIIQYKLGESIYFKFYDFTKAIEAGSDIYVIGQPTHR